MESSPEKSHTDNPDLIDESDNLGQETDLVDKQTELMALLEERSKPSETFTLDQVRETLGLD